MSEKLVSVVIPSYNYVNYLPQAVASVAGQTYQNIELVIVDDASTDDSVDVIEPLAVEHSQRFSGTKVIYNSRNMGAYATINAGIRNAEGEYVAVLNADDLYQPNRIETMLRAMDGAQFAFSRVQCIDAEGNRLEDEQARRFEAVQGKIAGDKPFMALAAVAENVAISTGNMLFTKQLFNQIGGFRNYQYVHDYDFLLRACLLTEPVFAADTAYLYRLHGENSFTKLAKEGLRENRMVWLDFYGRVRRGDVRNPQITKHGDYRALFAQAVAAEGSKKETLWKLSKNPLVRAGVSLMKKRYRV